MFRWLEDGKARDANRTDFNPSEFGGEEMRSVVEFRYTFIKSPLNVPVNTFFCRALPEHDGKVFECFSHNPTRIRALLAPPP